MTIEMESYNKGYTEGWNQGYLYALREMQARWDEKIRALQEELEHESK